MDLQLEQAFLAPHPNLSDLTRVLPKLLHPEEQQFAQGELNYSNFNRVFIADSKEGNTATGLVYVAKSDAHLNRFLAEHQIPSGQHSEHYSFNHGVNRAGKERITNYIVGTGMDALVEAWSTHFNFNAIDNIVAYRTASEYPYVCQIHFPNHFHERVPPCIFNEEFLRAAFFKEGFFSFHPIFKESVTNPHLLHTITQRYSEITDPTRNEKMCPPGSLKCHVCIDGETFK